MGKTAATRVSCPGSDSDSMASSDSSGTSLSEMGTFRRSNLPECLVELGNFLDKKYGGDALFEGESNTTKGKWLLVTEDSHKMSCRAQKIHENEMQKLAGQTDIIGSY